MSEAFAMKGFSFVTYLCLITPLIQYIILPSH